MLAVIRTKGHQHLVQKGDKISTDFFNNKKEGETISFDEVLLVEQGGEVHIGQPIVANAKVEGKIIKHFKGEKVKVFKMKPKKRYKKTIGFRPLLTEVEITSIQA